MRACAICGSCQQETIHQQKFLFPERTEPVHYDVVACKACGFVYADNIPEQATLNSFYQAAEHHLHATEVPEGLRAIHADFFDFVRRHVGLSSASRILDVGSGMGHFLNHFKTAGLGQLCGIEPSPAAARLARDLYDIEVVPATIHDYRTTQGCDLLTLCGVLEHIADLDAAMARIRTLLDEQGHLFIAVPDAGTFGDAPPREPFLEFALEHINFFTQATLDDLLRRHGFEPVCRETHGNNFYHNHTLLGLYRPMASMQPVATISPDPVGRKSIERYVALSRQRLAETAARIALLVESQEPVLVWGAGSLTARLMCTTQLRQANIVAVIDRNPQLQGKSLGGVLIRPPADIAAFHGATVFIASTSYADEIADRLLNEYRWPGKMVFLPALT